MKRFSLPVALILMLSSSFALGQTSATNWLTDYEKSGFKKTPRYEETMNYCRRLESASPWVKVTSFGKSPQGRNLPLVILSKEGAFTPAQAAKSGKAILLIQNGIHSGEIDGKDACLMLMRDIAITKKKSSLLDHVIVLIIPIYNVDGHERFGPYNRINQDGPEEMGWRVTAQNLNLNRDYVKADAPETQAWLKLFTTWLPDFFIDTHVTDGADFQHVVTYAIETHENLSSPVREWVKEKYLPMVRAMTAGGVPIVPYIFLRDEKDPLKGLQGGSAPPRFSTSYTTLQNRPGLLIETHMMKNYKARVDGTYQLIEATLAKMNMEYKSLRAAVRLADKLTIQGLEPPIQLEFETADVPSDTIRYFGFRQENSVSDISGGDRIFYTREPFEADIPRYDSVTVKKRVAAPVAYLIPQEWKEVIARLKAHGLRLERLTKSVQVPVEFYRFDNPKWQQAPFEGRHPVTFDLKKLKEVREFPAGTILVPLNQRGARVAVHSLEPNAPDAFAAWGFFDAVFEQKEYAEPYVMEKLSRQMAEKDQSILTDFEHRLSSDSAFTASPDARLNYFYKRSPYWDRQMNLYPVSRLFLTGLPTERVR